MNARLALTIGAVLVAAPAVVSAAHWSDVAQLCERRIDRAERRLKAGELESAALAIRSFEQLCIEGKHADKIEGRDFYSDLMKKHEEAESLLKKKKKEKGLAGESLGGPGGSPSSIRSRWRGRPQRCRSADAWNKASGEADASGGKEGPAMLSGTEVVDEESGAGVAEGVFDSSVSSSGNYPSSWNADDHLARLACGRGVKGIDSYYEERSDVFNGQILSSDPRAVIGDALINGDVSGAKETLYRAAQVHLCFGATAWNVKRHYGPYLYCRQSVGDPPSPEEVEKAAKTVWSDRTFEQQNITFMFERGLKAMKKVDEAFEKLEEKYPKLKQVYHDSAERARERYRKRHEKWSEIYAELDPITDKLLRDPESEPPEDCVDTLTGFR
ncbi:MAG: hypothetical protein ABEL76_05285, partial [Bradymonadaceae bacterium]